MGTRIVHKNRSVKAEKSLTAVISILPEDLQTELLGMGSSILERVEEIRLRRGFSASLTVGGRNLPLKTKVDGEILVAIAERLCKGSLYAYSDMISQGYISMDHGVRVGIVGSAACDGERIIGVSGVNALNFRIPHILGRRFDNEKVVELLRKGRSLLIYSPPGVGKTTLLRSLSCELSSGVAPKRLALIDTRRELFYGMSEVCETVDVFSGYPRAKGIEIATRTMGAELIVTDEIGGEDEARSIIAAQNCGVPFLATAHGSEITRLLRRTGISVLHNARVFDFYIGLERIADDLHGADRFEYKITDWEEADDLLKGAGCAYAAL